VVSCDSRGGKVAPGEATSEHRAHVRTATPGPEEETPKSSERRRTAEPCGGAAGTGFPWEGKVGPVDGWVDERQEKKGRMDAQGEVDRL